MVNTNKIDNKDHSKLIDIDYELYQVKTKLNNLEAEEVIIHKITEQVSDRLTKKFTNQNIVTLLVLIVTNISGLGFFLPQAERNITDNLETKIEEQVEENIDQQIDQQLDGDLDLNQKIKDKIDQELKDEI